MDTCGWVGRRLVLIELFEKKLRKKIKIFWKLWPQDVGLF